jgi:hypothetical protein
MRRTWVGTTRASRDLESCTRESSFAYLRFSRHMGFYSIRAATRQQFIIDILDVWLPASTLGLVKINDGVLGIFG